jgi:hypothetical protein
MSVSFILIVTIQGAATAQGLSDGQYSVLVVTNTYRENFLELALEVMAIPAIVMSWRRLVSEIG